MTSVTSPLNPGDNNENVANLKAALLVLIDKQQLGLGSEDSAEFPVFLSQEAGYGESTKRLVSAFQRLSQLTDTGSVDAATAAAFNKTLTDLGIISANGQPVVGGAVYMDYGIPANNIKLRLYAKGFGGSDTVLTETSTDKEGKYSLAYNPAAVASAGLEVRAVDAGNIEHVLSGTLYNTDKTASVPDLNLIAPSAIQAASEPEYTRLSRDVTSLLGDMQKLTGAQERGDRQDITFLSQNTNWDGSLIALASLSGKLSDTTGLSQEAAYALVRTGLPNDAGLLAHVSLDDVSNALDEADKSGLVGISDDQKKAAVTAFQAFANKTKLDTKNVSSLSTYNDLLANQPLTEAEKSAFATAYFTPRDQSSELWKQAKNAGISDDKIKGLQLQGKLGFLTADNAPLAQTLQLVVGDAGNLSKLVDEGLYEPAAWDAKLKELAGTNDDNAEALDKLIPPAYAGGTTAERKQAYTEDMAAKVRTTFPEKVMRNRIETGKIVLGDDTVKTGVAGFLDKAESLGYKLGTTHIDTFANANEAALFNGAADEQKSTVIEGVKMLNRVHQVTPNDESMQTLLALGHSSAQDIVAVPKKDFINRFGSKYADTYKINIDEAKRIGKMVYNKSVQVYTTTYSFFTAIQAMQQTPGVFAVSGDAQKIAADQASLSDKIKGAPNLQQLFGSLDFCECEQCRSVLSPAAYLVDLLQFLDRKKSDWDYFLNKWKEDHADEDYEAQYAKPYDALVDRRPDIASLPLTCENTNTALPYIDVVNEMLEYYLVNKKLAAEAAHDTGSSTTAELLAEPQNIEPAAYSIIKKAVYPLSLPFDLWIETVRQWCNQYNVPLWQVMETLQPADGADFATQKKIAAELLSISPAEYSIFSNEDPLPNLFQLYGFDSNAGMAAGLKSAKQLANRLGVTYKELLGLMQTSFINPQLNEMVLLQKMQVTVNDVFRYKRAADFTPFIADEEAAFDEKLATIKTWYGTDAEAELNSAWDAGVFGQMLLLNDTDAGCNFDKTTVGYADREALTFDWLKLNLFVRLWKKLGWTLEETDAALAALLPQNLTTVFNDPNRAEADRAKALAQALMSGLVNLAHLKKLTTQINAGKGAVIKLTTLFTNIPAAGSNSLYAQLFLSRSVLKADTIFDDALGQYLGKDIKLKSDDKDHSIALQAALHITASDLEQIVKDNGQDVSTARLTMPLASLLYRYSLLAKALKLSVSDLIAVKQLSGLDPFTPLFPDAMQTADDDSFQQQTLQFIDWVLKIKDSSFKTEDLNYLFRHQYDVTGKYRNVEVNAAAAIMLMSTAINAIQTQYAVPSNPDDANDLTPFAAFTDDVLLQSLSLLIPAEVVQNFMAMWTGRQAADWNLVKAAMEPILAEADFNALFAPDAAEADDTARQKSILQKRAVLAKAIQPLIQQKLIHQSVIQILAAATSATPARIEWLAGDATRLSDALQPGVPLIGLFEKANDPTKAADLQRAFVLLGKALQLLEGLSFSDKELQYFVSHAADFENFSLSKLPSGDNILPADTQMLFKVFIRLLAYADLRRGIAGDSDDLIDVFAGSTLSYNHDLDEAAVSARHLAGLYQQVAGLTRRDSNLVETAATAISITAAAQEAEGGFLVSVKAFADERGITALWKVLQLVQTFGVPVETLTDAVQITATGLAEEKCQDIAESLKNAVKARYETEDWLQIAQPIFDRLRGQRRDALVAYLLQQYPDLFSSLEEMYEYFLIDPGTEPVVQTSRIRIATASVQLFIQRCLLNLEMRWDKKVPPAVINARQWQWMNRYRVWEANRKIFLWPENWLEPEWRDDKTHLFTEMQGKLLQSDVSKDLVEDAFFVYLKKMEELAKLDIVAMHCKEGELSADDSILHVLGRTHGVPHKYFYRRYSHQMWTPWEPVDADISGDHIVTAVWHNRFHIFWVTFIEKIPAGNAPSAGNNSSTSLADWKVSDALSTVTVGAQKKNIDAHLHWSDYYQGKWSTKQSGGLDKTISAEVSIGTTSKDIFVSLTREPDVDGTDGALHINLSVLNQAYRIVNKNSAPEPVEATSPASWPYQRADNGTALQINRMANETGGNNLAVSYQQKITTLNGQTQSSESAAQIILITNRDFSLVPCNLPVPVTSHEGDDEDNEQFATLLTPFFYQDSAHAFYVEPALSKTKTLTEWDEWVGGKPFIYELPKSKAEPYHPWPKDVEIPKTTGGKPFINPDDPRVKVTPKIRNDWATNPDTYIKFDQRVIGTNTGMNVMVKGAGNGSSVLVKENNQLNHIIHNNDSGQEVMLVPAEGTVKASDVTVAVAGGVPRNKDGAANAVILVGSGGMTTSATQLNTQHLSGIFSNSASSVKFNHFGK